MAAAKKRSPAARQAPAGKSGSKGAPALLLRRDLLGEILALRGDALVVTGLGTTCYDVFSFGDNPLNFYNWAGMGGAAMVALGLARAQPGRRVLCITGDGEMLMGLGSFATIAVDRPKNLSIVVMDNEHYVETGMQGTHTGRGVDLAGIAKAAGFPVTANVKDMPGFRSALPLIFGDAGPVFVNLKVSPAQPTMTLPMRDGPYIRSRFRDALLGPDVAHPTMTPGAR